MPLLNICPLGICAAVAEVSMLWRRENLKWGRAGSCGKPEFNLLRL